jgi:hypothetical protein
LIFDQPSDADGDIDALSMMADSSRCQFDVGDQDRMHFPKGGQASRGASAQASAGRPDGISRNFTFCHKNFAKNEIPIPIMAKMDLLGSFLEG